jgi:hypothetical protein
MDLQWGNQLNVPTPSYLDILETPSKTYSESDETLHFASTFDNQSEKNYQAKEEMHFSKLYESKKDHKSNYSSDEESESSDEEENEKPRESWVKDLFNYKIILFYGFIMGILLIGYFIWIEQERSSRESNETQMTVDYALENKQ